jgi:hypothetical protein
LYLHNDINGQYLLRLATPEQCQRWRRSASPGQRVHGLGHGGHVAVM